MTEAVKCDRCGATEEKQVTAAAYAATVGPLPTVTILPSGWTTVGIYDFCPECERAFEAFMELEKESV